MFYHLTVTDDCNLCCSYCRAKMFDEEDEPAGSPGTIDETLTENFSASKEDLYAFLAKDPAAVLTFIGGEPLMCPEFVKTVLDEAPVKRFMLQTNGTKLAGLPAEYRNRFETILLSIDGDKALTDGHRGAGIYDTVTGTAKLLKETGFAGELIARMTVAEDTEIFSAVTHLADCGLFDAVHWQMDADFTGDHSHRRFAEWANLYNEGIRRLAEEWVSRIRKTGRVPKWYPFLSTTEDLLLGRSSRLRCGSGYANYSIMTNGKIAPCPIMVGMADYYAGDIKTADPAHLTEIPIGEPCTSCDIYGFCGGRCLYSNVVRPWGDAYKEVCATVRNLHDVLLCAAEEIRKMIDDGIISLENFSHTRYNGCEIIP